MKPTFRTFGAAAGILAIAIAGCGGGGGSAAGSSSLPVAQSTANNAPGKVTFSIRIPVAKSSSIKKPNYVSPNTGSISFTSTGLNSGSPVVIPLTVASGNCTLVSGSPSYYQCSSSAAFPSGSSYTLLVQTFQSTDGSGSALSADTITTPTIVANQANPITISLNGVVSTLSISPSTATFTGMVTSSFPVTISALDASGATIVGPGNLVDANGSTVTLSLVDSDTSGTTSLTSTGTNTYTFSYSNTVNSGTLSAPVTLTLSATGSSVVSAVKLPVTDTLGDPNPGSSIATMARDNTTGTVINVSATSGLTITATSSDATIATVNASAVSSGGVATFTVTPASSSPGGAVTISFADSYGDAATLPVTISPIANGSFTRAIGTTSGNWQPCSYARSAELSGPVYSAVPAGNTPEPVQNSPASTPQPAAGIATSSPLVTRTTPPNSYNPGWNSAAYPWAIPFPTPTPNIPVTPSPTPNPLFTPTGPYANEGTGSVTFVQSNGVTSNSQTITTPAGPPSVLGSEVALVGSIGGTAYPVGTFGICQTFTLPTSAPYLSFYVQEGGDEYTFKYGDQEAAVFAGASALNTTTGVVTGTPTYLFAEENCFVDPNNGLSPTWGITGLTAGSAGCWPASYSGDWGGYENWLEGGFWKQMGPYNLAASPFSLPTGTTYTLFIGNWSNYADAATKYVQFLYVGDVQMTGGSTFPSTAPDTAPRHPISVQLTKRSTVIRR